MSKSRSFLLISIPSATVFFSSACIMVLELVAGRLIAKHLGSSLYTWTSVIGVVLAGITVGNYLGGRIADRFPARKALAVLFGISSVACVITVVMNNLVGDWIWLWRLSLPVRVFGHVALVFLIPSTLLGTISPVVAKMALDRGLPTGRTVGDIYAWGAAGSIVGTFLAGFYLIATMGTIAIIWTIGGCLLLMAVLYWARLWVLYVWAAIFIALMAMGMMPCEWAKQAGASVGLREELNSNILYEDESQYGYIAVERLSNNPDKRQFVQDNIKTHSIIIMNNIRNLQSAYIQIYAAVTHRLNQNDSRLSVLAIGGGGYTYPRYVEEVWPGSRVDVAEIDSGVTEAAIQAFGLERDTTINTINMDARNYVDELLERQQNGEAIPRYDFVYGDAFYSSNVPFQLVTQEFNEKISQILAEEGVYVINLLEMYNSGLFLGSFINTLEKTFAYVYVLSITMPHDVISNFVVVAAKQEISFENLGEEKAVEDLDLWVLSNSDIEQLKTKAGGIVLTDDYAPVENLLAPTVVNRAIRSLMSEYFKQAKELREQRKWDESISKYKDAINFYPAISTEGYTSIGNTLAMQRKWEAAIEAFKKALEFNANSGVNRSMPDTQCKIGLALKKLRRTKEASQYMHNAIEGYRQDLLEKPDSAETLERLAFALAENGDLSGAIKQLRVGIKRMLEQGRENDTVKLQKLLKSIEVKK